MKNNVYDDFDTPPLSMAPKGRGRLTIDDLHGQDAENAKEVNPPRDNLGKNALDFLNEPAAPVDVEFKPVVPVLVAPLADIETVKPVPVHEAPEVAQAYEKPRGKGMVAPIVCGLLALVATFFGVGESTPVEQVAVVHEAAPALQVQPAAAAPLAPQAPPVASVLEPVVPPAAAPVDAEAVTAADAPPTPAEAAILPTPEARRGKAEKIVVAKVDDSIVARDTKRYREINYALGLELKKP